MASNFNQARLTNRLASAALAELDRGKQRAATKSPGEDTSAANAARVRAAGDGPWVPGHGDATNAMNSKK